METLCMYPDKNNYYERRKRWFSNNTYRHFRAQPYNRMLRRYNRCIENLALGRAKAEFNTDIDIKKGKFGFSTGAKSTGWALTDSSDVPGKSQAGLGEDKGQMFSMFAGMDKRILIGAALVGAFVLLR